MREDSTQFQSPHVWVLLSPLLPEPQALVAAGLVVVVVVVHAVPQAVTVCVMYTVLVDCSHFSPAGVGAGAGAGAADCCQSPQTELCAGAGAALGVVAGAGAADCCQSPQAELWAGAGAGLCVVAGAGAELSQSPQPELFAGAGAGAAGVVAAGAGAELDQSPHPAEDLCGTEGTVVSFTG